MSSRSPAAVVADWQDALNREDHDTVLRLSDPDIEIVGPRGSGFGLDLLRQWLGHTRVQLHPQRVFARDDTVVVAQHGVWRSPETGAVAGEADVASVFRIRESRVAYYARYDTLADALLHARLGEADLA
ncbi:MAG: nuclear transport factor 2 family protein [Gemmatimonadetes bacterium]|nr:nuclear transport factor 2 family protein [Gemmatimonadota bacterium]